MCERPELEVREVQNKVVSLGVEVRQGGASLYLTRLEAAELARRLSELVDERRWA